MGRGEGVLTRLRDSCTVTHTDRKERNLAALGDSNRSKLGRLVFLGGGEGDN